MLNLMKRDAIRVHVQKCGGRDPPEFRKFSVDPQLTSLDVLHDILIRAFEIDGECILSYLMTDDCGEQSYLPLISDWDLEAAFLSASDPCLQLLLTVRQEEWDLVKSSEITPQSGSNVIPWQNNPNSNSGIPSTSHVSNNKERQKNALAPRLPGIIRNQVEKTYNNIKQGLKSLSLMDMENMPPGYVLIKEPLNDQEFHSFLDNVGRLVLPRELREAVFQGGVQPSLRRVVWKHLLNVYPPGMTGEDRYKYIKDKAGEYEELRGAWQSLRASLGKGGEDLMLICSQVRKDVLRTDRSHPFFSGEDDNHNITALFNILTTYALNHPSVGYCQGMSDLASPLLVTMKEEAHAYICFCALMQRLKPFFTPDGEAMTRAFQHLSEALLFYDPNFFQYLKEQEADDLLFCYRWLLLELKREFAFEDALRMLEVLWSSLPPDPPADPGGLTLYEKRFPSECPVPNVRESPYSKVRALRRQCSAPRAARRKYNSLDSSSAEILTTGDFECGGTAVPGADRRRAERGKISASLDESSLEIISSGEVDRVESYSPYEIISIPSPGTTDSEAERRDDCDERCRRKVRDLKEFNNLLHRSASKPDESESSGSWGNGSGPFVPRTQDSEGGWGPWQRGESCESGDSESRNLTSSGKSSGGSSTLWTSTSSPRCGGRGRSDSGVSEDPLGTNSCEEVTESTKLLSNEGGGNLQPGNLHSVDSETHAPGLPPPEKFGNGNPFLMFLCLTLLRHHRNFVMDRRLDYNDLAMHFDKMVRRHNVNRVLWDARLMFSAYLKQTGRAKTA
ncbi:unnamed protein product [Darwinula stevensoni]|uniref:Rab-GAP TBC domain-containing protein n=1 Tax=Darwinula stevensoni TaxID=69355 RepID=A0A7R8WZN0_9CRUS|nr:unnamed protein product [Darwinula stevensoni]CAG0878510.1 unnamed protein product [Darwinula stevensoni]